MSARDVFTNVTIILSVMVPDTKVRIGASAGR
jgi:hypothetical protein